MDWISLDIRLLMTGGHRFLMIKLLVNPPSSIQFFLGCYYSLNSRAQS
uniref:Uncharacterized protein n=1 Tax=Manihot esculenta TaxID=3983 RepID=A0A199UD51_MANES